MSFGLGILKPDCLKRKLEKEVYDIIIASDLKIVFKKKIQLTPANVQDLYIEWIDKDFYLNLFNYMLSGEVEIFIIEGEDAISKLQSIVGSCYSQGRKESTIRGRFATSITENVIHSTRDQLTFVRETKLLLEKEATQWVQHEFEQCT